MIKNRYDNRLWSEIVGDLVTERTSQGDSIKLYIKYNGEKKPSVWLEFFTYDPEKSHFSKVEEITDWLDDKPYSDIIDDATGKPVSIEARQGFSDWAGYVDALFGPTVQSIVKSGGRGFSYEVVKDGPV